MKYIDDDTVRRGAREIARMWTFTLVLAFVLGIVVGIAL